MLRPGDWRHRLNRTLNAAYGDGLLSDATFARRLDVLLSSPLIEPDRLVGDLTFRARRRPPADRVRRTLTAARDALAEWVGRPPATPGVVLALDWTGARPELLVGRHLDCDVVVDDRTVSRRHARLRFRDGHWVLRDLDSTNGTRVNGTSVVRCRLLPGDELTLGDAVLLVD